jgi:hypothetical protein
MMQPSQGFVDYLVTGMVYFFMQSCFPITSQPDQVTVTDGVGIESTDLVKYPFSH